MILRSVRSAASAARRGKSFIFGMAMVARMPITATTTISSRRVKPDSRRAPTTIVRRRTARGFAALLRSSSPLLIGDAVEADPGA